MEQAAHGWPSEPFGAGLIKQLNEQLRMSSLVGTRWSELAGAGLPTEQLNEQLRMSTLVGTRWSELAGAGLLTRQLNEQLRITSLAAMRWSEVAGSARTARAWADLAQSLAFAATNQPPSDSRPEDVENGSLSTFTAWFFALPPRHRRAILNSLLGVVLSTCLIVQSVVPHRAPPMIAQAMELVLSILLVCSAISDATDE
jgi:hypothetical protein